MSVLCSWKKKPFLPTQPENFEFCNSKTKFFNPSLAEPRCVLPLQTVDPGQLASSGQLASEEAN